MLVTRKALVSLTSILAVFGASTFSEQASAALNLTTYTLTGTFALPAPYNTSASVRPGGSLLAEEASAVTYNRDTGTLFVVGDGGRSVVQVSKTGALIDSMTLPTGSSPQGNEFYDPEGIAYVGAGKFVMTEERYRRLNLFTYAPGTTLLRSNTQQVDLGTDVGNTGLEGVTRDPLTGGYILVNESSGSGGSLQNIFQTTANFATGAASNGSSTTVNAAPLFAASNLGFSNVADVFALSNVASFASTAFGSNVLVLSYQAGQVKQFTRSGVLVNTLNLVNGTSAQAEGMTMDDAGNLYVVGEQGSGPLLNQSTLFVYSPAPVPEPGEWALMLAGLGLVGFFARRHKRG